MKIDWSLWLLWIIGAALLFACFGFVMTVRQSMQWATKAQECAQRGGVSYRPRYGGPICLRRDALLLEPTQ